MRGYFGEIKIKDVPDFVKSLMAEAEAAGTFTRGLWSDKRQRGVSIKVDCYGFDEPRGLAVIQVRECVFHPRRYNSVRKDYYLLGHTEAGNIFAHPVGSPLRSGWALDTPEACVRWAECWVFRCSENQLDGIIRQGDVAFIPSAVPADAEVVPVGEFVVDRDGSHLLKSANAYMHNGALYVRGEACLIHVKGQHAPVTVPKGSWRVQVGYRAKTWGFSSPTRD